MNTVRRQIKAEDGYILLYVMVVVITLCILAASVCTSAVRNLKVQQHSVEHMKFVYEAEGIGERFVSEFQEEVLNGKAYYSKTSEDPDVHLKHKSALIEILTDAIDKAITNALLDPELKDDSIVLVDSNGAEILSNEWIIERNLEYNESVGKFKTQIRIIAGDSEVDAEIQWMISVAMKEKRNGEVLEGYEYYVDEIDPPKYNLYEIKTVSAADREGGTE